MAKELIVSVNGREKKIAIVEDDLVTEFYVERGDENQGIVGNIYKGRVMKVLPGMQSAFVDIGLERDSFLYVSDFFDEEEEDEDEATEQKREAARPARAERPERPERQERQRPGREIAAVSRVAPAEPEEGEVDLRELLSHIEEISVEPTIEPAPDDETDLDSVVAREAESTARPLNPRQRRNRRLRYAEPEPVEEEAVVETEQGEAVVAEDTGAVEAEVEAEDDGGRRRRRRRPRRGGDTGEADVTEIAAVEVEEEATPFVLVHHEPMERVRDDDGEFEAGDLLKDALLQERIAERIHEDERRMSLLEVEPTPEVLVGSWQHSLLAESSFERISDDAAEAESAEVVADAPAEVEAETAAPDATTEELSLDAVPGWQPEVAEEAAPEVAAEPEAEAEAPVSAEAEVVEEAVSHIAILPQDSAAEDVGETVETATAFVEEPFAEELGESAVVLPITPSEEAEVEEETEGESRKGKLKDGSASVRSRSRRGEMATRRGGRGRRRNFRPRQANDATTEVEELEDDQETDALAPSTAAPRPLERFHRPVITDLLREGQEVLVQIAKEPIGQKGARITSHIALPGRYIVYMPTVEHIGVSRKIGTDEERQRLKRTLHQLRAETGASGGFIVRTAANGCTLEELREDMQYLIRTWTDIRRRGERAKSPAIIHRDLDLVQRILRDQLSGDFTAIRVDNEFEYERIVDFVNRFAPKLVNRVKLYTKDTPILEHYGIQSEIDKAVKPRVWLKSGGYIVINQTEALVAIDVNTGKFVGKSNRLEDTIVKTNLEAAKEIVRQIRLRDLGGIIVLDFIDMEERKNRQKVMAALEQELRSDRSPSKILQFNDFGLVAITRKRVKQSLERTLCTPCSYCGGGGMVKSSQTICYEILAEARRISKDVDHHNEVILRVNPEVAKALRGPERDVLAEIEAYLGGVVTLKSDPTVHQEQFDIALA
ncbi:MAG: Rne/Rng family ribonuclease [Acidobacteria bacterium]|nr:Rne/Rng family ribonuclease [Acidobacteriota bacterium]